MTFGVLMFHEVNELDVVGPYSVLNTARAFQLSAGQDEENVLNLCTVAKSRNSVQTSAGMTITPTWAFASAPQVDVLVVPGGVGLEGALRDKPLKRYLDAVKDSLTLAASISGGALLLGAHGYLKDQVVTTHPELYERIEDYEVLRVSRDRLVKNERVWCAGGSSAGLDLSLEFVRHFYGDELAKRVRQHLDIPVQPGLF